jgi:hypothetical protein
MIAAPMRWLWLSFSIACADPAVSEDVDGDGVPTALDCDDGDPSIGTAATRACESECGPGTSTCREGRWGACDRGAAGIEICDGVDNDCNGTIDELDCNHRVRCSIFEESGTDVLTTVKWRNDNDGPGACNTMGQCHPWFGRCVTTPAADEHVHDVFFRLVGEDASDVAIEDGAARISLDSDRRVVAVSATGATEERPFFGAGFTSETQGHSHEITCTLYNGNDRIADTTRATRVQMGDRAQLCADSAATTCAVWIECWADPD